MNNWDIITPKAARKLWLEALRSGKYKQIQGKLQSEEGYCCLGVACEVAAEHGVEVRLDAKGRFLRGSTLHTQTLVADWLGLSTANGLFKEQNRFNSLVKLNDDQEYSFEELADLIESEPEELFNE